MLNIASADHQLCRRKLRFPTGSITELYHRIANRRLLR
ncbi:hypothetical protein EKH55_2268 [Sinorhizobium alkalisoli]|nr:hypothetical protein EKH55_2268 [Sinorhizobium alkalisoli]